MKTTHGANVLPMAVHCNGPQDAMANNTLGYGLMSCRSTYGIPAFFVSDYKTNSGSANDSVTMILARTPLAAIGFIATRSGNSMSVQTQSKFYEAATGDYYVSVFVLEDGIDGSPTAPTGYAQSGASAGYKHDNVLRASGTSNAYGDLLVSNPTSGQTINNSFTITLDPTWNYNNIYVCAIIWKKNGTMYHFVNGLDNR